MIRSHMTLPQVAAAARKDVGHLLRHVAMKHPDLERLCPKVGRKEPVRRSGHFTSRKGLQWIYVVVASQGRVTTYPLLWYPTTQGVSAMQIDAEGPAQFFQHHVMKRYIKRYLRRGDLLNALREFHLHNYDKVFHPDTYKNNPDSFAAAIDDGYVAGEYVKSDALVFFRTFYDQVAGRRRFGHLRASLKWRDALSAVTFEHVGRRDTPHMAWGRGYTKLVEQWRMAA